MSYILISLLHETASTFSFDLLQAKHSTSPKDNILITGLLDELKKKQTNSLIKTYIQCLASIRYENIFFTKTHYKMMINLSFFYI